MVTAFSISLPFAERYSVPLPSVGYMRDVQEQEPAFQWSRLPEVKLKTDLIAEEVQAKNQHEIC